MRTCLLMLLCVAGAAQADSFIGGVVTPSTEAAVCQGDVPSVKPAECPQGYILSAPAVGTAKTDEVIRLIPSQPKNRQSVVPMSPLRPGTVRIENSSISVSPGVQVNMGIETR